MARIRSVHPGIWTDEAFVSVSRDARLLFIGLLNECDDHGAFEWKPLQIKMKLCAGDDAPIGTVSGWLKELVEVNLVQRYETNGSCYGAVRNFRQWQRPKKPNPIYPMPAEVRKYTGPKNGTPPTEPEPELDEGGETPTGSPPVPHRLPTGGEIPSQMEETLGKMEEGKKESANADSGARETPAGGDTGSPPVPHQLPTARPVIRNRDTGEAVVVKVKMPKKRREPIPTDWRPSEAGIAYAAEQHQPCDTTSIEHFRDYYTAHGKEQADWDATWRNWCRNSGKFRGGASGQPKQSSLLARIRGASQNLKEPATFDGECDEQFPSDH